MLDGVDGVPYRVPVKRERDEVVPVPVNDLVEWRSAIHRASSRDRRPGG